MPSVVADLPSRSPRDERSRGLLARAQQETDPRQAAALREQVILQNLALAASLAGQFDHRGIEHDDLVQVAMVGLVQAVRRYRPDVGQGFAAFAVPTITGELKRHFRDHGWAVRPPRSLQELQRQVLRGASDLEHLLQRPPSEREISEYLGVPLGSVRRARLVDQQYRAISLDVPVRRHDARSLGDSIVDERTDPYDRVVALVSLRSAIDRLGHRDRSILRLRFVDDLTQQQIARRLGVSQMRVSRVLRDIYHELRCTIEDGDHGNPSEVGGWKSAG